MNRKLFHMHYRSMASDLYGSSCEQLNQYFCGKFFHKIHMSMIHPVWILLWTINSLLVIKAFLHILENIAYLLYGTSCIWTNYILAFYINYKIIASLLYVTSCGLPSYYCFKMCFTCITFEWFYVQLCFFLFLSD